jgi:ribosomal protein S18
MRKEMMIKAGYGKEVEKVENKICPFCGEVIVESEFKDTLSLKEYKISGLCQICQDRLFGKEKKILPKKME